MNIGLKWVNKNQHMLKQLTMLKQHAFRASNKNQHMLKQLTMLKKHAFRASNNKKFKIS